MKQVAALSLYRPLAGARYRIVAFPHAGGGGSAFMRLRAALASHRIELCPLQPPGRENRLNDKPHTNIESLVQELVEAIDTLTPLPTAFLGHSLGGLVAYLAARRFDKIHPQSLEHLVVSGSLSPDFRRQREMKSEAGSLRDRILSFGGIPEAIRADVELYAMFESIIAADITMGDAYRHSPSPPLSCPITVYSGAKDGAAAPILASGWQAFTRHPLQTRTLDGNHFFLYSDPEKMALHLSNDIGLHAFAG